MALNGIKNKDYLEKPWNETELHKRTKNVKNMTLKELHQHGKAIIQAMREIIREDRPNR